MKKLSLVLIILGILIILIPLLGNIYISNKQSSLYEQYLYEVSNNTHNNDSSTFSTNHTKSQNCNTIDNTKTTKNSKSDKNSENCENSENTLDNKNTDDNKKNSLKNNMDWLKVIGKLKIKKINVDLLFLKGSSDLQLLYGAGHMENTALPGESGNCCIAAHRGYYFGTYLYRANELNKNDIITVVHLGKSYNYSIYKKFYVSPKDTYVLKQPKDKKMLTIITCDPPIIGTRRLIIQANLIENKN